MKDLGKPTVMQEQLHDIRRQWLPVRCAELGLDLSELEKLERFQPLCRILQAEATVSCFVEDCMTFARRLHCWSDDDVLDRYDHVVFEGAQGLMLDQDYGAFPHVTRSNTGLKQVRPLVEETGTKVRVHYLSRAYATRHGAGPLAHEVDAGWYGIADRTNVENPHQGRLRMAPLDLDILETAVTYDLKTHGWNDISVSGILTCLDQVPDDLTVVVEGTQVTMEKGELMKRLKAQFGQLRTTNSADSSLANVNTSEILSDHNQV